MAWQSALAKVLLKNGDTVTIDCWLRSDGLSIFRDPDDLWAVLPKMTHKYPDDLVILNYGSLDTLGMILDMVDRQYPVTAELTKMELLLGDK